MEQHHMTADELAAVNEHWQKRALEAEARAGALKQANDTWVALYGPAPQIPTPADQNAIIQAIDPFTRGAFTGWRGKAGDSTITLDEAEEHFGLCMADMMDAARAAVQIPTPAQPPFTSWGQFCSRCGGKDAHCYICGIRRVTIEECAKAVETDKVLGRAMGELAANVIRSLTAQEAPAVLDGFAAQPPAAPVIKDLPPHQIVIEDDQPPAAPVETENGPADYADAGPGSVRTDQCADLNAPATSLSLSSAETARPTVTDWEDVEQRNNVTCKCCGEKLWACRNCDPDTDEQRMPR